MQWDTAWVEKVLTFVNFLRLELKDKSYLIRLWFTKISRIERWQAIWYYIYVRKKTVNLTSAIVKCLHYARSFKGQQYRDSLVHFKHSSAEHSSNSKSVALGNASTILNTGNHSSEVHNLRIGHVNRLMLHKVNGEEIVEVEVTNENVTLSNSKRKL
jgi:hypothetical protein